MGEWPIRESRLVFKGGQSLLMNSAVFLMLGEKNAVQTQIKQKNGTTMADKVPALYRENCDVVR